MLRIKSYQGISNDHLKHILASKIKVLPELWFLDQGNSEGFIYPLAFASSPFTWSCYSGSLIPSEGANGTLRLNKCYSSYFQVLWVTQAIYFTATFITKGYYFHSHTRPRIMSKNNLLFDNDEAFNTSIII